MRTIIPALFAASRQKRPVDYDHVEKGKKCVQKKENIMVEEPYVCYSTWCEFPINNSDLFSLMPFSLPGNIHGATIIWEISYNLHCTCKITINLHVRHSLGDTDIQLYFYENTLLYWLR